MGGPRLSLPAAITGPRVVAIARRLDPAQLSRIADGLLAGGVRAFEVTLDSPGAIDALAALAHRFAGSPLLLGAGTVLDEGQGRDAVAAGARFLVSPHTDPLLVAAGVALGVPVLPGAMTPSEILAAWRAGATAIKVFPASAAGPSFVREVRGPFRDIPLIPSGGVTIETAPAFIAAGAVAVGIGSWLTGDGDAVAIAGRASALVAAIGAD